VRDLDPITAIPELLARTFLLFHEADSVERTLAFLGAVVNSVPTRHFSFIPDSSAIDNLSEVMGGAGDA